MEQIGPYVLSHRIGAGGMAEVWMAHRAMLGASKAVAVKLLAPNLANQLQYRAMFREEARISMLLSHSNIVQVFDVGEDRGECYMAMEWVDGVNLAELQSLLWECGRAMPVELAMYITGELLRALDYAHNLVHDDAATIVHRDVSPANVLLSLAGEVKLTDFGVARFGSEETSGVHVKGKLRYMAPEQLRGCSKSGAVDIHATGAVLHEMLDGSKFRGTHADEVELIGTLCASVMPELSEPGRVPLQLDRLRRSMLAPEPGERPSAEAALLELRACPGYRHAAHELEALVRWCRGLAPNDRTHRPRRFAAAESWPSSDASGSESALAARTLRTARYSSATRNGRLAAASAVALAGLCVGCLGIGFAVRSLPDEVAPTPAPAIVMNQSRTPAEPPEADSPPPTAAAPPLLASFEPRNVPFDPALPPLSTPPPIEPALASEPAEPETPVKQRHDPVEVKFVAGDFNFAYVKVGNKRILIEPGGALQLSPGTHKVHVRFSADGEWAYFGKLNIRPKRAYLVKLAEPQRLEIKAVN
ncbi:MAG TPA: serine/threonine-protein kinase [Enhygromyxa sp.]|nr:serine/threonine-protein kinase [Enhygromyxa sp.]